jgi:hypothetical protein
MERLPKSLHASVRRALRQAWELDDADKAEKLIRNLARRLERDWSGVSDSILEGIDEILTVTRLGLPKELRRSLACTNIIENVMGTVRRVCRNVKRWRSASTNTAMHNIRYRTVAIYQVRLVMIDDIQKRHFSGVSACRVFSFDVAADGVAPM